MTKVVSHLHGQPSGFTSGLMASKIQDWLISSRNRFYHVYNKISFIKKRPSRPEHFELKKWNTNFRLQHSLRKNRNTFQKFHCSCKFSAGSTQTVAFQLLSNRIFRKLFVNGKQPKFANTGTVRVSTRFISLMFAVKTLRSLLNPKK